MRLTLRTMLAYMDDILEPADREEIGRKIEETEFARNLMERIRECIRKQRLGAPKLGGKGVGLDPNTVAEYLDNTLDGARVPDFERVCLESDLHLAEVAACHQVLTMVLGQPAEVDSQMKRRMYDLEEAAVSAPTVARQVLDGQPSADEDRPVLAPPRSRPEIPEYLRDYGIRSRWRTFVAAAAVLLVLSGVVILALGPLDNNPVLSMLGIGGEAPPVKKEAPTPDVNNKDRLPKGGTSTADAPSPDDGSVDRGAGEGDAANLPPGAVPPDAPMSTQDMAETPAAGGDPTNLQPAEGAGSSPQASSVADLDVPPALPMPEGRTSTDQAARPGADEPAAGAPIDGSASPLPMDDEPPADRVAAAARPGDDLSSAARPSADEAAGAPDEADMALARFVPGNNAVLLRFDNASGQWTPVPPGSSLAAGDDFLVLPTFRPTIALSAGITLQIPSETMFTLEPSGADGVPGIRIYFGRLAAFITGRPGARLRLDTIGSRGVVTFENAESTLAVEVRRFHLPGEDPVASEPRIETNLYAVSGKLMWTGPNGGDAVLDSPALLTLMPEREMRETAGPQIPKWTASEGPNLYLRAPEEFASKVEDENRPLMLTLQEMAEDRRFENKAFAALSLALLGQFEPIVAALDDDRQRSMWQGHINSLRQSLDRGPEMASKIREAFVRRRGESDGGQLFRMLWGYTRDELANGAAAQLVGYLEHDNTDFRLLAFTNLQAITGGSTYQYRPEAPPAMRKQSVNRWKEELRAGRIVPEQPADAAAAGEPMIRQP